MAPHWIQILFTAGEGQSQKEIQAEWWSLTFCKNRRTKSVQCPLCETADESQTYFPDFVSLESPFPSSLSFLIEYFFGKWKGALLVIE